MKQYFWDGDSQDEDCADTATCQSFRNQFLLRFEAKHIKEKGDKTSTTVAGLLVKNVDIDTLEARLRGYSKGFSVRSANKARSKGFTVAEFEWNDFLQDIFEINTSLSERNGKPMSPSYLRLPHELRNRGKAEANPCRFHWIKNFGVFSEDGKLVAYVRLKRQTDFLIYTTILGHGEYLIEGVMYLLHHEILAFVALQKDLRDCLLVYSAFNSGGDGLKQWKRRGLFEEFSIEKKK